VAGSQHPRKGPQGIAEKAGGQCRLQPSAVGGFRFALTAGEVVLLAASEEVPAVLDQIQAREQYGQGGVKRPGGWGCCGFWGQMVRPDLQLLPGLADQPVARWFSDPSITPTVCGGFLGERCHQSHARPKA